MSIEIWIISLGTLAILIYLEWKRVENKRLIYRVLADVLMIVSLVMLFLSPSYTTRAPELRVIINQTGKKIPDTLKTGKSKVVDSFYEYVQLKQNLKASQLMVLGHGLEDWQLKDINVPYRFFPVPIEEGITSIRNTSAMENNEFEIGGSVFLKDTIKLLFQSPGSENQTKILNQEENTFLFKSTPKVSGKYIYKLIGIRKNDTLFNEVYPVKVSKSSAPGVLLFTGSPSFEINYLKNFLIKEGFQLALRQQTSRDLFTEEFINRERKNLNRVTSELLEGFKILIIDLPSLSNLKKTEVENLFNKVKRGELGLFLMASVPFKSDDISLQNTGSYDISLSDGLRIRSKPISFGNSAIPILYKNEKIGEYAEYGLGRVAISLVPATYPILLKGKNSIYQEIWKKLLDPVSGYDFVEKFRKLSPDFPRKGYPTEFHFYYPEALPEVYMDSVSFPFFEYPLQPDFYKIKFWPQKEGWQSINISGEEFAFYAFSDHDWITLKQNQLIQKNLAFTSIRTEESEKYIRKKIPAIIYFLIFLLSAGFLWLEERI